MTTVATGADPLSHLPALCVYRAGQELTLRVRRAASFSSRLRGLLGVPLPSDMALHIQPCASVHMWGMRIPLDVLFLDRECRILRASHLRPWQMQGTTRAASVLECAAGTIQRLNLQPGQQLHFQPVLPSPRPGGVSP